MAVERYDIPPFVDGSCRREPDLQSKFPSITATCRARNFAPRLMVGDRIAYLTVRGRYLGSQTLAWRLVAVLRVVQRIDSHQAAAAWFRGRDLPIPSNCLVNGNPPIRFELTNGNPPREIKVHASDWKPERLVRLWDLGYWDRMAKWSVFLITHPEFLELRRPPEVQVCDFLATFGRQPATLNPPVIACSQLDALLNLALARVNLDH